MRFKTEIFDNSRLLTKFINENNIRKADIVDILVNAEHKYVLFYYE